MGKLEGNEAFPPEMSVSVIHGIASTTALPVTVATVTGLTPNESIPILCGRLHLQCTENPAPILPAPGATPVPSPNPLI